MLRAGSVPKKLWVGRFRRLLQVAFGAAMLSAVLAASPALADSVSVSRLPYSSEQQGTVSVSDQNYCNTATDYCGWYGEASAYPVSLSDAETGGIQCPSVFDASNGIWVGNTIDDPSATDTESFSFTPPASTGPFEVCLYTADASGDTLDTSGLGAATKAPGRLSVHLNWVIQCRVSLSAFINGGNVIGGKVLFAVTRQGYKTGYTKWPVSDPNWWFETGRGHYTISAKYLGDTFVRPSSWVTVRARISRCSKYR